MKPLISLAILLVVILKASAQNCDTLKFKKLESISRRVVVSDIDFKRALLLVKNLELNKCVDYINPKPGTEYVEASLTALFGEVCLKNNSEKSTNEYVKYAKRQSGSAEEEISFKLDQLFVLQPEYVLLAIGTDKSLLDQLEWGFVNNHYYDEKDQSESRVKASLHRKPKLNSTNYKIIFYKVNPRVKVIYPKYKRQIDYLLSAISDELK